MPPAIPRRTFWLGALVGVLAGVPLWAFAVLALAPAFGAPLTRGLDELVVLSAIFAGLPTLLAAGGVSRLVAHRTVQLGYAPRRLVLGAVAMASAAVGLVLLVVVPAGAFPEDSVHWLGLLVMGGIPGALLGVALAVVATAPLRARAAPVSYNDMA